MLLRGGSETKHCGRWTVMSGVAISQSISAKRTRRKPAARSVMKCCGSNQVAKQTQSFEWQFAKANKGVHLVNVAAD